MAQSDTVGAVQTDFTSFLCIRPFHGITTDVSHSLSLFPMPGQRHPTGALPRPFPFAVILAAEPRVVGQFKPYKREDDCGPL